MPAIRLTNGNETFLLASVSSDNRGAVHGQDCHGAGYTRCDIGCCEHEHAPADAMVWHDDEHTEELWQVDDGEGLREDPGRQLKPATGQ